MHTPYNRRTYRDNQPTAEAYPGYALRLAKYGYNVAVVDFRGLYASEGRNRAYNRGEWLEPARTDAYDVTEWLAKQPWSSGKIGMWGCSATGGSQMQAATTAPPHLVAIFPMSCEFDIYPFGVFGGAANPDAPARPGPTGADRDREGVPVDGPQGPAQLQAAIAQHKDNVEGPGYVPFRDSRSEALGGVKWWMISSPHSFFEKLKASKIAMYAAANWDEASTKYNAFFTFRNLRPRTKLIVGPGTHCDWNFVRKTTGFDIVVEELRWFDYWLKGVQNGVMREPGVTYFTYNAPKESAWRTSATWPLANEVRTPFYLSGGSLERAAAKPGEQLAELSPATKVTSTFVTPPAGGLTYATGPLPADVQVTGHPVLDLWIASDLPDTDVTAVIEDVAPDGSAKTYNMLGMLRASRRALAKPPFDAMGLPWHSHLEADARPLPKDRPAEVKMDLLPMSYIFKAGHRIQLRVLFAKTPGAGEASGRIRVLQSPEHATTLTLPIIPASP
jgi:hypothetical protein